MLLIDGIEIEMDVSNLKETILLYTNRFHEDQSNEKFNHENAALCCFSKKVIDHFNNNKKATRVNFLGHRVFLTDFAYLFPLEVQYYISYEYKHHLHWFWCLIPRFDLPGVMNMITK